MSDSRLFDHREAVCIADIQNRDKTLNKTQKQRQTKRRLKRFLVMACGQVKYVVIF